MSEWKRVLASRIGRTAGIVGCLMLTMAVNDDNGCAPEPGSGGECVADSDCAGDPGIDCVGAWSCDSAQCEFICGDPEPTGCYGDQDCSDGLVCNAADVCFSPPGCEPGNACPAVCYGLCVEPEPEAGCYSNQDCGDSQHCSVSDGDCQSPPGCEDGQPCPDVCYGTCLDDSETCGSNDDCGEGEICGCGSFGDAPAAALLPCNLQCIPDPNLECRADSDCREGFGCQDGRCVERTDEGCYADSQCGDGQICNTWDHCDVPGTDPSFLIACLGRCEDTEPQGCGDGQMCPVGTHCEENCFDNCNCPDWAPSDGGAPGDEEARPACDCETSCETSCVPDTPDTCSSDDECGEGSYCGCGDGGWGAEDALVCFPQCLPREFDCSSDRDCGDNGRCNIVACESDGGPAEADCDPEQNENCRPAAPIENCYGFCEYVAPPEYDCTANDQCESGICDFAVCEAQAAQPFCDPEGDEECRPADPLPAECYGFCRAPEPQYCGQDGECPEGFYCGCDNPFTPDADGSSDPSFVPCFPVCIPNDAPNGQCESDRDCTDDAFCLFTAGGGFCAPRPNDDCYADDQCRDGQVCVFDYDTCGAEPVNPDGTEERRACPGQCQEAPPELCYSDDQCGEGNFCNYDNGCGWDAANGLIACGGICEPRPPVDCYGDAQCGDGQVCVVDYDACGAQPVDASGAEDRIACPGQCQEAPPEFCFSDDECGEGNFCSYDNGCGWDPANGLIACAGICEPRPPVDCYGDDQCRDGQVCVIDYDSCGAQPVDPDGTAARPACAGQCEDPPPFECSTDDECGEGQACQIEVCAPCACEIDPNDPSGDCINIGSCPCFGFCEEREPEPAACEPTGCSAHVCAAEPVFTTCEWRPHYECYRLAECGENTDGSCGWQGSQAFRDCMERNGGFSSEAAQ